MNVRSKHKVLLSLFMSFGISSLSVIVYTDLLRNSQVWFKWEPKNSTCLDQELSPTRLKPTQVSYDIFQ